MQSHIHHKQHVSISSINSDGSARSRTVSSPPTSPIPHHRASMTNLQQNFLGQQRTSGAGGSGTHFHRLSPSASSDQLRRASNTVAGPSLSQTSNTGLSTPGGNNITDSVLSFQILNIIQSNDLSVILPALQDYIVSCQTTPSFGSPLHLAIPICSKHVVEQIINTFLLSGSPARVKEPFWVNDLSSPDGDTPLHIAARMKNFEVLDILFRVEGIDDSIRNSAGKIPEEVVKRTDVAAEKVIELFRRSRLEFIHRTNEKLRACVAGRTTYALYDFLSRDRRVQGYYNARLIDINSPLDSLSDATLLHYAAKEDSAELVEWCLRKGADPEIKDRKGRKPIDLLPKKDSRARDRLKNAVPQPLLVQSTSSNTSGADSRISVQPPAVRGVLKKWVNFSSGWKSRYFALEKGTFSYYKSEADYPESCRGSIASRIAVVEFPEAKDKSRFDVVGKGSVRFSLQARSPADAKRWVWALMEVITIRYSRYLLK
ncbi:hypothetical protein BC829DRAFT_249973 [Chytridium lagenaria]|nr:hypothetical protein BC829DRAFT_249973 [Chytridium lagenaria]